MKKTKQTIQESASKLQNQLQTYDPCLKKVAKNPRTKKIPQNKIQKQTQAKNNKTTSKAIPETKKISKIPNSNKVQRNLLL